MYRNSYIEINLDNLKNNAKNIISHYSNYKYYIGVVKSNCYGHGSYSVNALIESGINYLAVSNLLEAKNIRRINQTIPILCLEPINLKYLEEASKLNVTFTISNLDYLKKFIEVNNNKNTKIHIKINTGMNRLGINNKKEFNTAYKLINNNYILEGIFSHFHTIGYLDKEYENQIKKFKEITEDINLFKIPIIHLSKSSTVVNQKPIEFCNAIRIGAILYGIDVSIIKPNSIIKRLIHNFKIKHFKISTLSNSIKPQLKSSLSLYSEIIDIQKVVSGDYIGYGLGCKVKEATYIGVVCLGHCDGLHVNDSDRFVYINDKKYKLFGKINSNMATVIIDDTVKIGDSVCFYSEKIDTNKIARSCNTSVYNLYGLLHESLPRIYVKNKVEVYREIWEIKNGI